MAPFTSLKPGNNDTLADRVHIAASCDDNYARHLGVMLHSLLSNASQPTAITLHIINAGISTKNLALLTGLVEKHGAYLNIINADDSRYEELPVFRYGPAVYQRISLPILLNDTISKVIYLDSDIVVRGDISELWETPLHGQPLGAVENLSPTAHQDIGLPRQGYFNSGVLIMDLVQWRNEQLSDQVLSSIASIIDTVRFVDQCGLNLALQGRWRRLPLKWNQQSDIYGVFRKSLKGCGYSREEFLEAMSRPAIVHYIGKQKPWLKNSFHPFKPLYLKHLAETDWAGTPFKDDNFLSNAKYRLSLRKHLNQWRYRQRIRSYR